VNSRGRNDAAEERFDVLSRALARRQSRRASLRLAGYIVALSTFLRGIVWPLAARALPARQAECPPFTPPCGNVCTDVQTDPNNCGACGVVCGPDEACRFGFCGPIPACADTLVLCGDTCVDLQSDQRNCGWCGTVCQNWERCTAGVCIADPLPDCPPGLDRCDDFCVDFLHDDGNCGGCGHACKLFVTECREGRCVVIEEPHIPGS
jgi:hypothetical protein